MATQETAARRIRIDRWGAIGLALAMLVLPYLIYVQYIYWVGFPDGYASELDTAERALAVWISWLSTATGVVFLALVARSFFAHVGRWVLVVCALYLLAVTGTVAVDLYDRTYMMDSRGG